MESQSITAVWTTHGRNGMFGSWCFLIVFLWLRNKYVKTFVGKNRRYCVGPYQSLWWRSSSVFLSCLLRFASHPGCSLACSHILLVSVSSPSLLCIYLCILLGHQPHWIQGPLHSRMTPSALIFSWCLHWLSSKYGHIHKYHSLDGDHSVHHRASQVGQWLKNLPANGGDTGSTLGWERSSGEGNGNPLQYSCLENPMDRGAWCSVVHGMAKNWTRLSDSTTTKITTYGKGN